jgi:hypothetical protein
MKILKALVLLVLLVLLVVALLLITAGPTMLVLGGLNKSGLTAVPALGFWQTLGALFVTASFGGAFHSGSIFGGSKSSK